MWLQQGWLLSSCGSPPWLCSLPSLEQLQELEGSWVLGDPLQRKEEEDEQKATLFLCSPLHELWVPPSIPKLRLLTLRLKSIRHIRCSPAPPSARKDSVQPQQPGLPLPPAGILLSLSSCEFQNFQDGLRRCGTKGLDTRARATPEPAERAPNLTPLGNKAAALHVHPFLLRAPHALSSLSPRATRVNTFWPFGLVPGSSSASRVSPHRSLLLYPPVLGA